MKRRSWVIFWAIAAVWAVGCDGDGGGGGADVLPDVAEDAQEADSGGLDVTPPEDVPLPPDIPAPEDVPAP